MSLGACIDTPPLAEPVIESSHVEIREVPEGRPPQLDLLVVLDDSPAMASYQDRIAALPSVVANTLESFGGRWIDLRIAVTTNDGHLRRLPDVAEPYLARRLDFDMTEQRNYTGTFEDAFTQLLAVGTAGEGPHQPLEAMRHALETSSQFLREPAPFSLLVIGGSDDASPLAVADYVEWAQRLTRGIWWRPFIATGVYPKPAPRLDEFFTPFFSFTTPLDGDDYLRAFRAFSENLWGWDLVGSPCFDAVLADRDPATPGLQPDCTVSLTIDGEQRALPECGTAPPVIDRSEVRDDSERTSACWKIQADLQNCTFGDHLLFRLEGYTQTIHPAYRLECRSR